ncbi:aspartic proteinase-like protein 2 isoform X2 [Punica granatum]|uniref:Aspartic proteinase-like protein 2 isoform X2 n=1 Tax=Punica granatum TaxID=22663 RepID=A0A6P8CP52_PUNGR|nr:aspartic proteinase-like protein 2 isoform X2 [Punica granatum]
MAAAFGRAGLFVAVAVLPLLCRGFPATLNLERAFPVDHRAELSRLVNRDLVRHGRLLQSSGGVIDFHVQGTFDPFVVGDFYVQIDTGSDVLWVSCRPCNGCPESSGLHIPLNFFDPGSSSTASPVSCSDQRCSLGIQSSDSGCSTQNNMCSYTFQYGDGSGTSGYYVSDLLNFDTIVGNSLTANSTARIVFGCSTTQTGDLTKSDRAVDGIFGFGQQGLSVISQLASEGIAPKAFSHCLRGDGDGGGILVLGEIVEPSIVYTPLVPSQPHYNLNLQSISVNGQTLPIDPSVFATSNGQGTIVDSGTTLAYVTDEVYNPLVNAVTAIVSQAARVVLSKGNQCYIISLSVNEVFPQLSLNFEGGASLLLGPQDYLLQQSSIDGSAVWCMGFQKIQGQGITILGDLVLKNKIFVYDLAGQRIGWANYDCSMSVNVSTAINTGRNEYVNTGDLSRGISIRVASSRELIICCIIASVLCVLITGIFQHL